MLTLCLKRDFLNSSYCTVHDNNNKLELSTLLTNKTTLQNDTIPNYSKLLVYDNLMKYLFLKAFWIVGHLDDWSLCTWSSTVINCMFIDFN